ncbi:cilia- and flagella-associated protein 46-like [Astyanax mexicanus]|uniref:Cilia- and flagella-associated protein 46-like n=1 Tax=Astyanax mexicanus TaxID=7994 RepID=A0A8T2M3D8_ASTMX|nr:cilia- and flagella-associated protein 46-like [Astyanax mexicanus]
MLSSSACLRGLSMLHKSVGHPSSYTAAHDMLQSSISYAEQAVSWTHCGSAAKHYWNACLPLVDFPEQRHQLREPLELILKALNNTYPQPGNEKCEVVNVQKKPQAEPVTTAADTDSRAEDVLAVRAAILLYKQRVLVKAQQGQSVVLDVQRFTEEGELDCALMWHHVAHCAIDKRQKLSCYQNAINTLQSVDNLKQKVDFLREFGEWQYSNNFPLLEAQLEIQKSIQIILSSTSDSSQSLGTTEQPEGVIPVSSVFDLREVWCLDGLVRANTLLALMESKASSRHQQYLFLAYSAVLQIWKVSMERALEVIKEEQKNLNIPALPASAASIKKEKEREKGKRDASPSSSPEERAQFECPEVVRPCFRQDSGIKVQAPGSEKSAAVGSTSRRWHRYTEQELWLDKASVCLSLGLYQPARSLLAETHLVAKELGDQTSLAKSYHLLAVLASLEQQHGQALALLDQAQEFVGDEGFWYHLI